MNDFRQVIYDKVKVHALKQNKKCEKSKDESYLHYYNDACFAGCLIPRSENLNGSLEFSFYRYFRDSGYIEKEIDLIVKLVCIHDGYEVENWKSKLEEVAEEEGLNL